MFQQPKLCPAEPVKFKLILLSRPSSPKFSAMNPEVDAPTDLSLFVILNFKVFDLFERNSYLNYKSRVVKTFY